MQNFYFTITPARVYVEWETDQGEPCEASWSTDQFLAALPAGAQPEITEVKINGPYYGHPAVIIGHADTRWPEMVTSYVVPLKDWFNDLDYAMKYSAFCSLLLNKA
jgi:hypothetical protein